MLLSIGRREELFGIGRLRLFLDGFRSGAGAVLAFALLLGNGSSIGVTLTRVDTSCSRSMLIGTTIRCLPMSPKVTISLVPSFA
mgnify:CR=1 FL=1